VPRARVAETEARRSPPARAVSAGSSCSGAWASRSLERDSSTTPTSGQVTYSRLIL
jgi:hypothetical protein